VVNRLIIVIKNDYKLEGLTPHLLFKSLARTSMVTDYYITYFSLYNKLGLFLFLSSGFLVGIVRDTDPYFIIWASYAYFSLIIMVLLPFHILLKVAFCRELLLEVIGKEYFHKYLHLNPGSKSGVRSVLGALSVPAGLILDEYNVERQRQKQQADMEYYKKTCKDTSIKTNNALVDNLLLDKPKSILNVLLNTDPELTDLDIARRRAAEEWREKHEEDLRKRSASASEQAESETSVNLTEDQIVEIAKKIAEYQAQQSAQTPPLVNLPKDHPAQSLLDEPNVQEELVQDQNPEQVGDQNPEQVGDQNPEQVGEDQVIPSMLESSTLFEYTCFKMYTLKNILHLIIILGVIYGVQKKVVYLRMLSNRSYKVVHSFRQKLQ
jgi:hypothetical protein